MHLNQNDKLQLAQFAINTWQILVFISSWLITYVKTHNFWISFAVAVIAFIVSIVLILAAITVLIKWESKHERIK